MSSGKKRLVIAGGGAAGFFCAVNAARLSPGLEVVLLEKTGKLLSKVKVSGGGRCNVTHNAPDITYMAKRYPRGQNFVKKSFSRFFVPDTIAWFRERGVVLKAEEDGRMFPVTDDSQTIIDCLLREADKYHLTIRTHTEVTSFKKDNDGRWRLQLQQGPDLMADYLCIAAGGYAQAAKFAWLEQTGHSIVPPAPSLFTFNMPGNPVTSLMGVATIAQVKVAGTKLQEQGPLLITHWGMSGPAVLRLSAWGARELQQLQYTFTAIVNWIPSYNENTLREQWQDLRFELRKQKIYNKNPFGLPQRLWQFLLQQAGVGEEMRWADVPAKDQNRLMKLLVGMEFPVKGKTTFKEEFVTCGGVALSEVNMQTLESRHVKGLYFAGEVLDIDGITGGFNFQAAWTTGFLAGKNMASN
jgi:predicted Rossmann fold flavoprotein